MKKVITWVDLQGRYRVTSPAYSDELRPVGETEDECLERVWARLVEVGGYGIPVDHPHFYVEDEVQRAKLAECCGNDFRYSYDTDSRGQRSANGGAWEMDADGTPKVNMAKARAIHMDAIRAVRNAELAKQDIPFIRAVEAGDTEAQARIGAEKQVLRDIPATFDLTTGADTPVVLANRWPVGLPHRG